MEQINTESSIPRPVLSSKNDPKKEIVKNKRIKKKTIGEIEKLEITKLLLGSRKKI